MSSDNVIITYDVNDPSYQLPEHETLTAWLINTAQSEKKQIARLSYSFVSDEELLILNRQFLDHDTLTDILTFPYDYSPIEADICISYERVLDNARDHETTQENELLRVIVHGLLHMCGYTDETAESKAEMRTKEDHYLKQWTS